jgi:hypothetical protein
VIFGAGITSGLFLAGTNGFVTRTITSPNDDIAGDKLAPTAGTYTATASLGSAPLVMQAVGFHVG